MKKLYNTRKSEPKVLKFNRPLLLLAFFVASPRIFKFLRNSSSHYYLYSLYRYLLCASRSPGSLLILIIILLNYLLVYKYHQTSGTIAHDSSCTHSFIRIDDYGTQINILLGLWHCFPHTTHINGLIHSFIPSLTSSYCLTCTDLLLSDPQGSYIPLFIRVDVYVSV